MDYKLALRVAKDNWYDVDWWRSSAIPFAKRTIMAGTLRPYYQFFGPEGDNFMDEDWDNLLILDACRYDMFDERCEIDGELSSRTSVGASTPEFLKRTFRGGSFEDTVYVTANPQVNLRLDSSIFYDVVNVWESDWNDELGTVEPDKVTNRALDVQDQYPNKRLIVHYMQPHYPFIGEGQSELENHSGFELTKRLASGEDADRDYSTVWDQLKNGDVSKDAVLNAYGKNLDLVLDNIQESKGKFQGKTIITSDHGNLVGEVTTPYKLRLYGHPTGIHAEPLVTVPWLEFQNGPRKEITTGEATSTERASNSDEDIEMIEDRLQDLGYV